MGVVYQAVHETSGELVALKTVRVPRQGLLASIRREIHVLAAMHHPGVIRVVARGVHRGRPWYAMELLQGMTLRSLLAGLMESPDGGEGTWWTGRLESASGHVGPTTPLHGAPAGGVPLPQIPPATRRPAGGGALGLVLNIVHRLCAPLAYLHGEGIVHRDLKPDNVLVRPDGTPVLVDFGLTSRFGVGGSRDALEMLGEHGGTYHYVAPEQAQGETVDARADLYSLGCILYELLTGEPPFTGEEPAVLIAHHLGTRPLPPSRRADGIAPELDELVMRLLEKDPRRRLGYADAVAHALREIGCVGDADGGPRARPYLYRPRLSGRDEARDRLVALLDALVGGKASMAVVGGESGVGKTRLLVEVAARAARGRISVHTGEGVPVLGAGAARAPLGMLRRILEAVADRCIERGPGEIGRLLGPRWGVLGAHAPALAALPGFSTQLPPADLPPDAARLRLFDFLTETLAAFAAEGSHLLILDDLQWADELSLSFLEYLLAGEGVGRLGIAVIGAHRSDERQDTLDRIVQMSGLDRVHLGRLDDGAVAELVGDMLAVDPPSPALTELVSRQAAGNPFFVSELLRNAVEQGMLVRDQDGSWRLSEVARAASGEASPEAFPMPGTLRELIARRLDQLSPRAQRLLGVAAVLGREMEADLLAAVAGGDEESLMEPLGQLVLANVLEESDDGCYRFVHQQLRDAAYDAIAADARRVLHGAAAAAIETLAAGRRDAWLADLGTHLERAGDSARARERYLEAAWAARDTYALAEAERLFGAFLSLASTSAPEALDVRLELARVLNRLGRGAEAEVEARRVVTASSSLGDGVRAALARIELGTVLHDQGRMDEARACFEAARDAGRHSGDESSMATAVGNLANLEQEQGRLDVARGLYDEALALHRKLGNRAREAVVLSNLGVMEVVLGRLGEGRACYERALALDREIGDRRNVAIDLGNLASVAASGGKLDEARTLYEQALELAREVADRRYESHVLGNLAGLYAEIGFLERSLATFRRALEIGRGVGDRRFVAHATAHLGEASLHAGHRDEAATLVEEALRLATELSDRRLLAFVHLLRGTLAVTDGALPAATEAFMEAAELANAVGDPSLEARAGAGLARAARYRGDLAEARTAVERLLGPVDGDATQGRDGNLLVELGHVQLAMGEDSSEVLDEARRDVVALGLGADSPMGRAVRGLDAAAEAWRAGKQLAFGELPETCPIRRTR